MTYIRVNRSDLVEAASKIDDFISEMKFQMKKADNVVEIDLADGWSGEDYAALKKQWAITSRDEDSNTQMMINGLSSYAQSLRNTSDIYREAQITAIEKANCL